MMKKIMLSIGLYCFTPLLATAICPTTFINPITGVCWECTLPIKLATIPIIPFTGLPDVPEPGGPVCICIKGNIPVPGISVSFWEPSRVIETVKDPYCFPTIGLSLGSSGNAMAMGSSGQFGAASDVSSEAFHQVHWMIFPLWSLMGMMLDFLCIEQSGVDIGYMTEIDPLWNDDSLMNMLTPETLLFANPISVMSCMADAIASGIGLPIDSLYWCMGGWGTVFPNTGNVNTNHLMQAHAAVAGRMMFKLSRELLLWDNAINICYAVPTPIWVKSHYRIHVATPVRDLTCRTIGEPTSIWGSYKNPTGIADNHSWMLFKKRVCCML